MFSKYVNADFVQLLNFHDVEFSHFSFDVVCCFCCSCHPNSNESMCCCFASTLLHNSLLIYLFTFFLLFLRKKVTISNECVYYLRAKKTQA